MDTESTGLAGELKIRTLDENLQALLCPMCNAANLLAANSAQTAQEHFVKRAVGGRIRLPHLLYNILKGLMEP